jgi:hypothetical protein
MKKYMKDSITMELRDFKQLPENSKKEKLNIDPINFEIFR